MVGKNISDGKKNRRQPSPERKMKKGNKMTEREQE